MKKTEKADLKKMPPEALIEAFVYEAKLNEPGVCVTARETSEHDDRADAYLGEIAARGGLARLMPLLHIPDNRIAYYVASAFVARVDTKEQPLATLDHLAEQRSRNALASAHTARNMVRYGTPWGSPKPVSGQH